MSNSYSAKPVREEVVSAVGANPCGRPPTPDAVGATTRDRPPTPDEEHIDTAASKTTASSPLGILLALIALYILWGGTYLGMRIALQSFPPFILAGVRFLIAGVILYVFLRARGA